MVKPKCAYFQGKFVPYEDAKIGVMTHALNYGTAVFGGVRGYWNEDDSQLYLFRPGDHFKRFLSSAKIMVMDLGVDIEALIKITIELLKTEELRRKPVRSNGCAHTPVIKHRRAVGQQ